MGQVGLISDLRRIVSADVNAEITVLQQRWQENWSVIASDQTATTALVTQVDSVRSAIKQTLLNLDESQGAARITKANTASRYTLFIRRNGTLICSPNQSHLF